MGFYETFPADLGAAVHSGMVVIGEKLGLYKALVGSELFNTAAPVVVSPRVRIGVGAFNYYGP
jgi:hypothetical protein